MHLENTEQRLMQDMPVPKAILKLAIPTVLSTIVSLLYNLTDTYFIGLLDDPIQLGAISLAFPVFLVIQAIGNIFGNGAPSYISRCLGAKNYEEVRKTSSVSFYISILTTLLMTVVCFLFMTPILNALGTSSVTIEPTRKYLNVIVGSSVILTMQVILPALLRSEGKIKEAVIGMIIGTALNIILDPIFILGFHLGVAGAAWASVIGNFFAVIYYIIIYTKGHTTLSIKTKYFKPSKQILREVLKIGFPASVAQILMSFSNILLNNLAAAYGDHVISAYGVAGKLISMVYMITIGYVSGYMPFAGYNFGAKNRTRVISAWKFTLLTSTGICIVLLIPFLWLARPFIQAFSSNPEIIDVGIRFLHAQAWALPFMGVQLTMMSTFQAAGQAVKAMIVNLGRQCLFYIPMLYIFNHFWQLTGLMHAQMATDLIITLIAVLLCIPILQELRVHPQEQLTQNI